MALTSSVDVVVKIFESFRNFFGEVTAHPPTDALKQYVQVDQKIDKKSPKSWQNNHQARKGAMTLSIVKFNIMTLSIMTFKITTLGIMTFNIMTLAYQHSA